MAISLTVRVDVLHDTQALFASRTPAIPSMTVASVAGIAVPMMSSEARVGYISTTRR
jgi:hypothetical protein